MQIRPQTEKISHARDWSTNGGTAWPQLLWQLINVPTTRLERQMEAAQSICTWDNVAHSQVNHHQMLLDNWNILTFTG